MKSKINDRKIKLLLHKLGYLRLEIEVKSEELSQHEQKFNQSYYTSFVEEEDEVPPPAPVEDAEATENVASPYDGEKGEDTQIGRAHV